MTLEDLAEKVGAGSIGAALTALVALTETSDLTTYDTIHYDDASTTILAARDAALVRGWIG